MPTFPEQMLEKLQTVALQNAGARDVTVDGTRISFSDLKKEIAHWERKVLREKGQMTIGQININIP